MRGILLTITALWSGATLLLQVAQAQTVERMEIYRDAAVLTWRTECSPGSPALVARSLTNQVQSLVVCTDPGDVELLHAESVEATWTTTSSAERRGALEEEQANLRLDRALKVAQLDLVEEDLALLRENRRIGGTSEAVLVEDIEEVSEWMHDAFREALYRRVELREEVASLDAQLSEAAVDLAQQPLRSAYEHRIMVRSAGTVWCQTVEHGAGWTAADAVNMEGARATWTRRVSFQVDVPYQGAVEAVFVDANWGAERSASSANVSAGYERKVKKPVTGQNVRMAAARYEAPAPVALQGATSGEVHFGTFQREAVAHHHSIPSEWEGVMTTLSVPEGKDRVIQANRVSLRLEGEAPTVVPMIRRADSLHLEAGWAPDWTVLRNVEPALCSRSTLGNRVQHRRAFVLEVGNQSAFEGTLLVVEPLPGNRALEIEVNPDELDGGFLDEDREQLVWTLTLKPGESRTLRFGYDVSHDRDLPTPDWR